MYFPALRSALIDQPKAPKHQSTEKHGALDDVISPTICNQSVFSSTPDCPYRSAKSPNRHDVRKDVGLEVGLAEKIIDLVLKDTEIKMSEMADQMSFNPITHIK